MATQTIQPMQVHSTQLGWAWEAPEAATQTYLLGAVVVWSAGYIQEAGADPTLVAGIALRAGQNGATAGAKTAHFVPVFPGLIIEANLAQAAADTTSAATDIGKAYGIVKRSTGTAHWVIDSAETVNTRVRIIGFAYPSVVTDVDARVYAIVFAANGGFSA